MGGRCLIFILARPIEERGDRLGARRDGLDGRPDEPAVRF